MMIHPKPGNQPDTDDMSGMSDGDGEAHNPVPTHPNLAEEEEEAARLGDFA